MDIKLVTGPGSGYCIAHATLGHMNHAFHKHPLQFRRGSTGALDGCRQAVQDVGLGGRGALAALHPIHQAQTDKPSAAANARLDGRQQAVQDVGLGGRGALGARAPALAQDAPDVRVERGQAAAVAPRARRGQPLAPGAHRAQVALRHHRQVQLREHLRQGRGQARGCVATHARGAPRAQCLHRFPCATTGNLFSCAHTCGKEGCADYVTQCKGLHDPFHKKNGSAYVDEGVLNDVPTHDVRMPRWPLTSRFTQAQMLAGAPGRTPPAAG